MGANNPLVSGTVSGGSPSTLYVAQAAYASLPAGTVAGQKARATDVGLYGSEMSWNGSRWIPSGGVALLGQLYLPVGIAPTVNANASGTANGATTFATASPLVVYKGFWYVPANTIVASHAAGFYYGEMTSTTAITFYNNTYTPAAGVYPTEPTSKVAFSGAVPGGAGATGFIAAYYYSIPAGLLGAYGEVSFESEYRSNNTAGAKNIANYFGSSAFLGKNLASKASSRFSTLIKNMAVDRQESANMELFGSTMDSVYALNINTGVAVTGYLELNHSTATDIVILKSAAISARVSI